MRNNIFSPRRASSNRRIPRGNSRRALQRARFNRPKTSSLSQEKLLVASILGDLTNWVKDIRRREVSSKAAQRFRTSKSLRPRRGGFRVRAEDMDGEPIELDDEVEIPMDESSEDGDEGGSEDDTEIGLVVDVTDAEGEPLVSVEVESGEVVDVQASRVRKVQRRGSVRRPAVIRKAVRKSSISPLKRRAISRAIVQNRAQSPNKSARLKRLASYRNRLNKRSL